jgi:DNA repair exonuclease SbcCD ATPase subunit
MSETLTTGGMYPSPISSTLTFATEEDRADIFDAMEKEITQLKTKLAESEARIGRLESALSESMGWNWLDAADSSEEMTAEMKGCEKVLNETPAQSLAAHDACRKEILNNLNDLHQKHPSGASENDVLG